MIVNGYINNMKTKQIKEELRLILKDYHYNNDEQHMSKDVVTALENLLGSIDE